MAFVFVFSFLKKHHYIIISMSESNDESEIGIKQKIDF